MKKNISSLFLVFTLVLSVLILGGCKKKTNVNVNDSIINSNTAIEKNNNKNIINKNEDSMMKKDLQITDITMGSGPEAKNGNKIMINMSVDVWGFAPVSVNDILVEIEKVKRS